MDRILLTMEQQRRVINFDKFIPTLSGNKLQNDNISQTIVGDPNNLDLEANWLLIRSLLETGLVERILLDQRLILAIKRYTLETGELTPEEADRTFPIGYNRMWTHTAVVHHAPSHKEHMHVRTFCWAGS